MITSTGKDLGFPDIDTRTMPDLLDFPLKKLHIYELLKLEQQRPYKKVKQTNVPKHLKGKKTI